jgi:hypothetical protein
VKLPVTTGNGAAGAAPGLLPVEPELAGLGDDAVPELAGLGDDAVPEPAGLGDDAVPEPAGLSTSKSGTPASVVEGLSDATACPVCATALSVIALFTLCILLKSANNGHLEKSE